MYFLALAIVLCSPSCINVANNRSIQKFDCTQPGAKIQIVPGTPQILIAPTHCHDYIFLNEKMSKAINIFVEEYSSSFDISERTVWSYLSRLKIEVSIYGKQVPAAFDVKGNPVTNAYVNGLALSKKHIWIEVKTKQINTSALIHELVHIVIWNSQNVHGDPDHEGHEYSGWNLKHTRLIERVNIRLMELGI